MHTYKEDNWESKKKKKKNIFFVEIGKMISKYPFKTTLKWGEALPLLAFPFCLCFFLGRGKLPFTCLYIFCHMYRNHLLSHNIKPQAAMFQETHVFSLTACYPPIHFALKTIIGLPHILIPEICEK